MPASAQASCACYQVQSASYISCGPSSRQLAEPTVLAKDAFDDPATSCYNYLVALGHEKAAEAISGRSGNRTVIGAGFCGRLDDEAKRSWNGSSGLAVTMGVGTQGACEAIQTQAATGGASGRRLRASTFDRVVAVSDQSRDVMLRNHFDVNTADPTRWPRIYRILHLWMKELKYGNYLEAGKNKSHFQSYGKTTTTIHNVARVQQ